MNGKSVRPGTLRRLAGGYERLKNDLLVPTAEYVTTRARRMLAPFATYGVARVYAFDLKKALEGTEAPPEFTARELTPDELSVTAAALGLAAGEFHRRAHLGDRCFATFKDTRPVHVRWVAFRPVKIPCLSLYVCPASNEFYMYDSYTLPSYRGRHACAPARRLMARELLAVGYKRGYRYFPAENDISPGPDKDFRKLLFELFYLRVRGSRAHYSGKISHPLYTPETIPVPAMRPAEPLRGSRRIRAVADRGAAATR